MSRPDGSGPLHSPAPWRAVKPRSLWRIKDANGHFVMEGGYCNVRNQQDAYLIAAAPDLLEAASQADCACSVRERASGHLVECWMPALKDAIAKALGNFSE